MKSAFLFTIMLLFVFSTYTFSQVLPDKANVTDIISVAFSPDSSMLAIKVPNGIHLYDPNSLLEITFIETISSLTTSNFSPDGTLFACGSKDNSLIIMDVKNRIELATLTGHQSKISSVSFSPDGNLLASGSEDGTIKLWDAKTRLGIATFKGQTGKINSLSFSANGKFLISTDSNNTLKLWDPKTYQELATLKGRLDWSLSPNFTPDMTLAPKRRAFTETLKLSDLRLANPNVLTGDTTTIEALSVYSGDETALKHIWTTNAGVIQGSGNKATYRAPERPGTYSVNVRATDGAISSERTAEINVEQGKSESSILLSNNTHWPAKEFKDKLSYNVNITRIPETKVIIHFDITQDKDKFDSFLIIEIDGKVVLQDMAIGNEQPSTGIRTIRDIDVTNIIKEPRRYTVTFYMRPGDRTENGWLMNEARIIGVEGSVE